MKIEQEKVPFIPVVITLETAMEVDTFITMVDNYVYPGKNTAIARLQTKICNEFSNKNFNY